MQDKIWIEMYLFFLIYSNYIDTNSLFLKSNKSGRIHFETGRTASVVVEDDFFNPVDIMRNPSINIWTVPEE